MIVRLSSPPFAQEIIKVKKRFNYFTVADIKTELLKPEITLPGPGCKVFINEALSNIEYNNFNALKEVAKIVVFNTSDAVREDFLLTGGKAAMLMFLYL